MRSADFGSLVSPRGTPSSAPSKAGVSPTPAAAPRGALTTLAKGGKVKLPPAKKTVDMVEQGRVVVRHTFYGKDDAEAQHMLESHKKADESFADALAGRPYKGVDIEAVKRARGGLAGYDDGGRVLSEMPPNYEDDRVVDPMAEKTARLVEQFQNLLMTPAWFDMFEPFPQQPKLTDDEPPVGGEYDWLDRSHLGLRTRFLEPPSLEDEEMHVEIPEFMEREGVYGSNDPVAYEGGGVVEPFRPRGASLEDTKAQLNALWKTPYGFGRELLFNVHPGAYIGPFLEIGDVPRPGLVENILPATEAEMFPGSLEGDPAYDKGVLGADIVSLLALVPAARRGLRFIAKKLKGKPKPPVESRE